MSHLAPLPHPILAVLAILAMNLGFAKTFPWSVLPWDLGRWLWVGLTVGFVAVIASHSLQHALENLWRRLTSGRGWLWVLLGGNAAVLVLYSWYFAKAGYTFPWLHLVILTAAVFWLHPKKLERSAILSLLMLVVSIWSFPLDDRRSDMLILISKTLDIWMSGGHFYELIPLTQHASIATYPPGTLLSHLPAWMLGLDLRWNMVLYRAAWMGLLLFTLRRHPVDEGRQRAFHFFLLSPYWTGRHELYFEFFLGLIVMFFCTPIWKQKVRALVGAAGIWTRQWAWIWVPFILLREARTQGWIRTVLGFCVSLGISAVVLALLGVGAEDVRRFSTAHQLLDTFNQAAEFPGDYGLTFAPLFFMVGINAWIPWAQFLACAIFGVLALLRPGREIFYGFYALSAVILFNGLFWNYLWLSWTLAILVSPWYEATDETLPHRPCL